MLAKLQNKDNSLVASWKSEEALSLRRGVNSRLVQGKSYPSNVIPVLLFGRTQCRLECSGDVAWDIARFRICISLAEEV